MTTLRNPNSRISPPRQRDDPLVRPPDFPPTPPGREHLSKGARAFEEALDELDAQLDYEDIHGPGTSQGPGSKWRYIPSTTPPKDEEDEKLLVESTAQEEARRVWENIKSDFAAKGLVHRDELSSSSASDSEEEEISGFRSFANVTHKREARERKKNSKDSSREEKIKRRDEENEKLAVEMDREWTRRMRPRYGFGGEEVYSTSESESESEGRDPSIGISGLGKKNEKGKGKEKGKEVEESSTEREKKDEEEVHWLQKLNDPSLTPAEREEIWNSKFREWNTNIAKLEEDSRRDEEKREKAERVSRVTEGKGKGKGKGGRAAAGRKRLYETSQWGPRRGIRTETEMGSTSREEAIGRVQRRYDEEFWRNTAAARLKEKEKEKKDSLWSPENSKKEKEKEKDAGEKARKEESKRIPSFAGGKRRFYSSVVGNNPWSFSNVIVGGHAYPVYEGVEWSWKVVGATFVVGVVAAGLGVWWWGWSGRKERPWGLGGDWD